MTLLPKSLPKLRFALICALLGLCSASSLAEMVELSIDPMTSTEHWQVGGRRINYTLGTSSLISSSEQTREGGNASLKLTYDFEEPPRDYISAYHIGDAIPGRCEEVFFWLYGDASNCRLRLSVEDARGRWFQRLMDPIDWEGWREIRAPIGDGEGWRPLLRRGEGKSQILHPVNLREIALLRAKETPPKGAIFLHDLRATSDVVPADFVAAKLSTGREANLFYVGETTTVIVELTNGARTSVAGRLAATVTELLNNAVEIDLGPVTLSPGETIRKEAKYPTDRLGAYTCRVTLRAVERERIWFGRLAVSSPAKEKPVDASALFGCCFNVHGFSNAAEAAVFRLNRDAGIHWTRIGFNWREINHAPGVWAWDRPKRVDGPLGNAIELEGQVLYLPHSTGLDCRDAVTIAFWGRGTGPNNRWQTPLQEWGGGGRRNYGVYFHLKNGNSCFSASYANFPDSKHVDFNSGFSAWDNQWHHFVATYSRRAKKVVLYVDGEAKEVASRDGGELRTNKDDIVVGGVCPAALDEMILYRRALGHGEVAALARKSSPPTRGLVAWWSFDEDQAVLKDSSINHLDLTTREPSAPRMARLALENGVKTVGILGFPPKWASSAPPDAKRPWVYKPKLGAWSAFVENVTRRCRDIVQHWEIWNEPNINVFWMPEPNAKEFFDVVKTGDAAPYSQLQLLHSFAETRVN